MADLMKNPNMLGGLVSIILGILVYYYNVLKFLDVAGFPTATIVLIVAGLAAIYMGMKK